MRLICWWKGHLPAPNVHRSFLPSPWGNYCWRCKRWVK